MSFEVIIAQVACGHAHTSFFSSKLNNSLLKLFKIFVEQGFIFSFGSNSDGQLGIGDKTIKFSTAPLLVSEIYNE